MGVPNVNNQITRESLQDAFHIMSGARPNPNEPFWSMKSLGEKMKIAYFVTFFGALGWLGSQVLDRAVPAVVFMQQLETEVDAGNTLPVQIDLLRWRICDANLFWTIRDGADEIKNFGPIKVDTSAYALGQAKPYIRGFKIPRNAASGDATLLVVREYVCPSNYIQEIKPIRVAYAPIHFRINTPAPGAVEDPPIKKYKLIPHDLSKERRSLSFF